MSEAARRLLVAYDVSSDTRRDNVATALQAYGERIQYSVFLIDGRPADFVRLRSSLTTMIDPRTDRVLFCDLGDIRRARGMITYLGRAPQLTGDRDALIL